MNNLISSGAINPDCERITAPHFTAGVVLHRGVVVRAAPIVAYACGWTGARLHSYCERKGWRVEAVDA